MYKPQCWWRLSAIVALLFSFAWLFPTKVSAIRYITDVGEVSPEFTIYLNGEGFESRPRAQDDFYMYVNYDWLKNHRMPHNTMRATWDTELKIQIRPVLAKITSKAIEKRKSGSSTEDETLIADFMACIRDRDGREKAGLGSLKDVILKIEKTQSIQEYVEAMAHIAAETGFHSLIGGYKAVIDPRNGETYMVSLLPPDTGLAKEYLTNRGNTEYIRAYRDHIRDVLRIYGHGLMASEREANDILEVQKDIANTIESGDVVNATKIKKLFGHIDTQAWLNAAGIGKKDGVTEWVIPDINAEVKLSKYLNDDHLDLLKAYSTFQILEHYSEMLPSAYEQESVKWQEIYNGARADSVLQRDQYLNEKLLSVPYSRIYVANYFDNNQKKALSPLIKDITAAYREQITKSNWLDEETRTSILTKFDKITYQVAYPERWPKVLDGFQVITPDNDGTLIDNVIRLERRKAAFLRKCIGAKKNEYDWAEYTPLSINAFYHPSLNSIIIPAVVLQPPIFDAQADRETQLSTVGIAIAHEISHAFDSFGYMLDADGRINENGWTDADKSDYEKRQRSIRLFYCRYGLPAGENQSVIKTLQENIADIGAMACVSEMIGNDIDVLQRFYTNYARFWREKATLAVIRRELTEDVHSFNYVRVNGVLSSNEKFYRAFDVRMGDGMYVAPKERAKLW